MLFYSNIYRLRERRDWHPIQMQRSDLFGVWWTVSLLGRRHWAADYPPSFRSLRVRGLPYAASLES